MAAETVEISGNFRLYIALALAWNQFVIHDADLEQDLHPVSLEGASRNVCVVRASQNSAYQKHTAACQASDLAFSAPQLSE